MNILKAWISVDGVAIDDEAIASTVTLDLENGKVRLGFPTRATEVDAIARGKRFGTDRDFEMFRILVCTPVSTKAQLVDESGVSGYEIYDQPAETTKTLAWVEFGQKPNVSAEPIQIVDKITGANQIVIKKNGAIVVSQDLVGKTVRSRLPVFVDKRVVVLLEPLENFRLHIVTEDPTPTYLSVLITIEVTSPTQGGTRWLQGTFDPASVERKALGAIASYNDI